MQQWDQRRKKTLNLAQAQCLSSPARTEIVDALGMLGEAGAQELAKITGLSVNTLHYHLTKLIMVGLVEQAGKRPTATKGEDLFKLAYKRVGFDYDEKSLEYREAQIKAIRQFLKLCEKESTKSLHSEHGMKGAIIVRTSQKLSKSDIKELRSKLSELGEWARSRHDEAGQAVSLAALTVIKAPE